MKPLGGNLLNVYMSNTKLENNDVKETFKPISNFPGYFISDLGKVMSQKGKNKKILKTRQCNGYEIVDLHKDGKRTTVSVHRLVAEAFIHNPLNLPEINHKDQQKNNNVKDNLEFCTRVYNVNYTHNGNARVARYDLKTGEILEEFSSQKEMREKHPEWNYVTVNLCINSHTKSAYGWGFKFLKEDKDADD